MGFTTWKPKCLDNIYLKKEKEKKKKKKWKGIIFVYLKLFLANDLSPQEHGAKRDLSTRTIREKL